MFFTQHVLSGVMIHVVCESSSFRMESSLHQSASNMRQLASKLCQLRVNPVSRCGRSCQVDAIHSNIYCSVTHAIFVLKHTYKPLYITFMFWGAKMVYWHWFVLHKLNLMRVWHKFDACLKSELIPSCIRLKWILEKAFLTVFIHTKYILMFWLYRAKSSVSSCVKYGVILFAFWITWM